jgi:hypothetical protein
LPRAPEDLHRRLEQLLKTADELFPPGEEARTSKVPLRATWRFLVSSLQAVASACGPQSPHLRELERCRQEFAADSKLNMDICKGVLESARDDLSAGMLADLRQLVAAEAFGDLLESAVYFLDEKHHVAAVSICGAVLEASLRSLAKRHDVTWSGPSSITKINSECYKSGLYDKVVFSEVESWARLRNAIAHGDFSPVEGTDSGAGRRMLDGVREFVHRYR